MAPDHSRCCRSRQQAILPQPHPPHTIGESHLDDDLNCFFVPVPSITRNNESTTSHRHSIIEKSIEDTLDVVVKVITLHENFGLLAQS
jgi:hypothetical protein